MYSNLTRQASILIYNARNEVRFSTKPYCTTGLIEYQFRKYVWWKKGERDLSKMKILGL
jgi:hypothetical protein